MLIKSQVISINRYPKRKKSKVFYISLSKTTFLILLSMCLIVFSILNFVEFFNYVSYENTIFDVICKTLFNFPEEIRISEYTVLKGDTIYSISKKLNTSISTLVSLNGLSSYLLFPGRKVYYSNRDVVRYRSNGVFSVFDVSKRYNVHPYEVFVANGYKFWFSNECLVPGVQLSWSEVCSILGIGFLKPLVGRITSSFGYRIHPVLGVRKFHSGLDISAPYGHRVKAAMSGVVESVGYDEYGYGYYVVISHPNKMKTLYGHLSKILVKVGQKVRRGDVIGKVGDTGMTTGPHLHFEVIKNGTKVNPRRYIVR